VKHWVAILALASGTAMAADDAALRIVEECSARLDARTDVGIDRIQKRCPELMTALASAEWRDLLPPTLRERRDEISAQSLQALVTLVRQSQEGTSRAIGSTRCSPILATRATRV
jgi:hypothetical protein